MQFLVKLDAHALMHAIIFVMQFCQYWCLSTRLDFRNTLLGDEDPKLNKSIVFYAMKIRLDFHLYFFEIPLYL